MDKSYVKRITNWLRITTDTLEMLIRKIEDLKADLAGIDKDNIQSIKEHCRKQ